MQNLLSLKKMALPSRDRFSSLPDTVLLHILSFLPFDDVVRLTLLCKQFKSLYTFSTALNFIHIATKDVYYLKKFISFIHKSLISLHPNNKNISKFHLEIPFKKCFASDVTLWVIFAINHKVKELNLVLYNDDEELYKLPKKLFLNPFLEKLNWVCCNFDKVEVFKWDSLKELRIGYMEIKDDICKKIVFGSPNLDFLELDNCWGFTNLDLVGGNLSKLVVIGYGEMRILCNFELEIEAPSVKVLELKGCFKRRLILLKNVMNCVSVNIDFKLMIPSDEEELVIFLEKRRHMMMSMFGSLRHVKDVVLGTWCIEIMSSLALKSLPFSMAGCECLTLHTPIQERYLPGIICLLNSSFNLRTLIIHMAPPYFEFETCFIPVVNDVHSVGGRFQLSLLSKDWGVHLKKIRICGFEGMRSGREVLFLRDLLLITENLEKMVIEWRSGIQISVRDPSDEFVAESLLSVQRRSRNAVILFKNF